MPAGESFETYGQVSNKLEDASKISMVFALDYTTSKANLNYIAITDSLDNENIIPSSVVTTPTDYI